MYDVLLLNSSHFGNVALLSQRCSSHPILFLNFAPSQFFFSTIFFHKNTRLIFFSPCINQPALSHLLCYHVSFIRLTQSFYFNARFLNWPRGVRTLLINLGKPIFFFCFFVFFVSNVLTWLLFLFRNSLSKNEDTKMFAYMG